jgi:hypothetical protein
VLLLWFLFAQAVTSLPELSITFDEPVHITTGYSIWETGDLRLMELHPPLLEMWMSWPLHLSPEMPTTEQISAWVPGDRRLFAYADPWWSLPIDSWLIPARITVTLLSVLLGAVVFRWTTEWFGLSGGLLALTLVAFDPNFIAHTSVGALDSGITLLVLTTMYLFQRMLRHPTPLRIASTGILLGLSLSTKVSGGALVPVTSLLLLSWGWRHWERRSIFLRFVLYGLAAFLTVTAVHLFTLGEVGDIPFPVPAPTFWRSVLYVGTDVSTESRRSFLLGEVYTGGRWYYFPIALLLKTPLATILLACGTLLLRGRWFLSKSWHTVLLAALPVTYLAISMVGAVNIGYRHILPTIPFLYVFIGAIPNALRRPSFQKSRWQWAGIVLVAALVSWQALGTLAVWPYHLTYFNEIAGGPDNGYRFMADSNVDWNQALKAVQTYVEEHGAEDIYLSPFAQFVPLHFYDLEDVQPLPPLPTAPPVLPQRYNPAPGTYIISASTLRGLQIIDPEMYNWFWHREPDEMIANAMLVYHVKEPNPSPGWVAQCHTPVVPLAEEILVERFGHSDLRVMNFDCTQSWIYPQVDAGGGWFAIHQETLEGANIFMEEQLTDATFIFEQKIAGLAPPHRVYLWTPQQPHTPETTEYLLAPVAWPIEEVYIQGHETSAPVPLAGPLTFQGHALRHQGRELELTTTWLVTAPVERPLSLMAHLVDATGQPIAVGDGLGISIDQLQPGDLVVQRHPLSIPSDLPVGQYWLQTGAYWLDTMETLPVASEGDEVDRILLGAVRLLTGDD